MSTPIYIIEAIRTPFGKLQGKLSNFRADDLLTHLVHNLIKKYPQLKDIENTYFLTGCSNQAAEDSRNIARQIALLANLPLSTQGTTFNALCNSGIEALLAGIRTIKAQDADLVWVSATENMSRAPIIEHRYTKERADSLIGWRYENTNLNPDFRLDMGNIAEHYAKCTTITRQAQDEYAYFSRLKYEEAKNKAYFSSEIIPLAYEQATLAIDEQHRTFALEALERFPPLIKNGAHITLGNSARAGDGAVLLLLASEQALSKYNLKAKAQITNYATIALSPTLMNLAAIEATKALAQKSPNIIQKADCIEISESFALQTLLYRKYFPNVTDKCNIFGGAISIGNPTAVGNLRLFCNLMAHFRNNPTFQTGIIATSSGLGLGSAFEVKKCPFKK